MKQWDDATAGAALRKLTEACERAEPYRAWVVVEWSYSRSLTTPAEAWEVRFEKHVGDGRSRFRGATPTEALDAARKAIE